MTTAAKISNRDLAPDLAERGWHIFPCKHDKTPQTSHGMKDATTDQAAIKAWWQRWPDALIGIYCERSGFFALDIDVKDNRNGRQTWAELVEKHGAGKEIAAGPVQLTPSGGYHVLFKLPEGVKIPNTANKLGEGLDLRSNGYICTGGAYTWLPGNSPEIPIPPAPAWLVDLIRKLTERKPSTQAQPAAIPTGGADPGAYWLRYYLDRANLGSRNQTGFELACQLRDSGLPQGEAESILCDYAARVPGDGYTEREALASCSQAYNGPRREAAHLPGFTMTVPKSDLNTLSGNGRHPQTTELPSFEPPPGEHKLDDIGNGERLAIRYGARLRYVFEWGWLSWTGKTWQPDRGEVAALAKATARAIYAEVAACEDDRQRAEILKHARSTAYKSRQDAMVSMAQSEPGIPARPSDFDQDPWLLNCANGILDLRTGELQPHDPAKMLTKIAGAEYDPEVGCPTWTRFLDRIFEGDQDLIGFIRRAVGYSLTGNTGDQVLFFLYGTGANGKTTFTDAIQALLGDYCTKTPTDTLMTKYSETGIPNDLARLAGARTVIAAELAEGKRLNESLVKDLTGGDRITARYLHREFFEFKPIFKLWMYGNHKPTIRGTDEAIWRRIKLIPFNVTIPEPERDSELGAKLRAELPGILNWALDGCLEWQRSKLQTPSQVDMATSKYRGEQDVLARFLEECCITTPEAVVTAGELHTAYRDWGGELNQRRFSQALTERGYTTEKRDSRGRAIYRGLGLLVNTEAS